MKPSIEQLIRALQRSWSVDTSSTASEWSDTNPARGQCVVSSLVVQHYLGGDLRRYHVTGNSIEETHYCNILDNGTILDTTLHEYTIPVTLSILPMDLKGFATLREKRLADENTQQRYELLLHRVEQRLTDNTHAS